ncbi:MAG: hypothetical protein AB1626_00450 [Candidatus Micrarchaeota archaeon]
MKYAKELRQVFGQTPVFSTRDVAIRFRDKGMTRDYAKELLHVLSKKGEVSRIRKGAYSFSRDAQVVGAAFSPYYYGLHDALSLRNLWEQETNPVVITPRRVRPGVRTFLGGNYLVKRIAPKMFFGFECMKYGDFWINVATPEKTLVDFAYFNQRLPETALAELTAAVDEKKLAKTLAKCSAKLRRKVRKMLASQPKSPQQPLRRLRLTNAFR